jgi:hypothetical protein
MYSADVSVGIIGVCSAGAESLAESDNAGFHRRAKSLGKAQGGKSVD